MLDWVPILHAQIAAQCPSLVGVSVGVVADKTTWIPQFKDGVTAAEKTAASNVIAGFDVVKNTRRLIVKSLVVFRLTDAQLDAALIAMTNRQKERWRSPDHPAVYVDDPELLALLKVIGADPAVVLA